MNQISFGSVLIDSLIRRKNFSICFKFVTLLYGTYGLAKRLVVGPKEDGEDVFGLCHTRFLYV